MRHVRIDLHRRTAVITAIDDSSRVFACGPGGRHMHLQNMNSLYTGLHAG